MRPEWWQWRWWWWRPRRRRKGWCWQWPVLMVLSVLGIHDVMIDDAIYLWKNVMITDQPNHQVDLWTDRWRSDGRTDGPFYRDRWTRLKRGEGDSYLIHDWGFKLMAKRINFSPLFSFYWSLWEKFETTHAMMLQCCMTPLPYSLYPIRWCYNAEWLSCPSNCIPCDAAARWHYPAARLIVCMMLMLQFGMALLPYSILIVSHAMMLQDSLALTS